MSECILYVKKIHPDAKLPSKSKAGDAAYDIASIEDVSIKPGGMSIISTGISFTAPVHSYGQIAPRSGLSTKGLFINAGVIDRGFTGEIKVVAYNFGPEKLELPKGSRIAQVIFKKIYSPSVHVVNGDLPGLSDDESEGNARGDGGFGSTGI